MLETELENSLSAIAPVYLGSKPQNQKAKCYVYSITYRKEELNEDGFSGSTQNRIRVSCHGDYEEAKQLCKQLKQLLHNSVWDWEWIGDWDYLKYPPDGSQGYFVSVICDLYIWSNSLAEESLSPFSSGFLATAFGGP